MTDDPTTPQDDPLDDWDLDDDELSLGETIKLTPIGLRDRNPVKPETDKVSPSPKPETFEPKPSPAAPAQASVEDKDEDAPKPARRRATQPPEQKEKKGKKDKKSSTTAIEKISLLLVCLTLFGLVFWGISTFLNEAPEGELIKFTTDFPVQGEKVTIKSVETWWRTPVTTGEDADFDVVPDTELIPCARITLEDGDGTTLQASFRDGEGQLIGDTLNLVVTNGKFAKSDSSEITVHATAGFTNASNINPYVNGDVDPWALIIVESEDPDKEVVKVRVSKKRLEN